MAGTGFTGKGTGTAPGIFFFFESLDLRETSKLTAKTHRQVKTAFQLGGQRA